MPSRSRRVAIDPSDPAGYVDASGPMYEWVEPLSLELSIRDARAVAIEGLLCARRPERWWPDYEEWAALYGALDAALAELAREMPRRAAFVSRVIADGTSSGRRAEWRTTVDWIADRMPRELSLPPWVLNDDDDEYWRLREEQADALYELEQESEDADGSEFARKRGENVDAAVLEETELLSRGDNGELTLWCLIEEGPSGRPPGRPSRGTTDVERAGQLLEGITGHELAALRSVLGRGRKTSAQAVIRADLARAVGDLRRTGRVTPETLATVLECNRATVHRLALAANCDRTPAIDEGAVTPTVA